MVSLGQNYHTDDLPASQSFDLMPVGEYKAMIEAAEVKDTKSGGKMIVLTHVVMDEKEGGKYQNRKVWQNLNLQNPSEAAEKIGKQQLGDLLRAIGKTSCNDTDELIEENLIIVVGLSKADPTGQYEQRNEVKRVKALEGSAAPGSAAPGSTPPWGS